ncbi:MAG: cyclopropane-fatty-acyl-phospholipid synthase [Actinomycetota bacterium]|nr:cyclopropane-fatty-acyl-phospholipid synthase [Actinomycetota bacterium]
MLGPILHSFLGADLPVRFRFWDGSEISSIGATTVTFRRPEALRRLIYAPNELGIGRAYVAGDIDIDGDVFDVLALRDRLATPTEDTSLDLGRDRWLKLLQAARQLNAFGRPLPPPPEEARLRGRKHSKARDAAAIAHHYDVSNDFYRLLLGETMTYSCAYFPSPDATLEEAQSAKYELICRKLGLAPGMRLLDVGCGWGGMVLHAAQHHGVDAVGVTISQAQADLAAKRVAEAGLADKIEIRLEDYRELSGERFDAISSIGMFEHVGLSELRQYFQVLHGLLEPRGRLLNHGISRPPGPPGFNKRSFIARYVFPDGELHEIGTVVSAMQREGFEVRDVEAMREHYNRTLRVWVANLESDWEEAVALAGEARARIWRLYLAGSALGFQAGRINLHQVLGVKPDGEGNSGIPPTRASLLSL